MHSCSKELNLKCWKGAQGWGQIRRGKGRAHGEQGQETRGRVQPACTTPRCVPRIRRCPVRLKKEGGGARTGEVQCEVANTAYTDVSVCGVRPMIAATNRSEAANKYTGASLRLRFARTDVSGHTTASRGRKMGMTRTWRAHAHAPMKDATVLAAFTHLFTVST
jgi:hypothetical protein